MANAFAYQEDYEAVIQERLIDPSIWREICKVDISNKRVVHNPYSTPGAYQSGTRGNAVSFQDVTITDESVTVNQFQELARFIDHADLAQSKYADIMLVAEEHGKTTNEKLDNLMLAQYANWTDFGTVDIGAGGSSTDQIAVSVTNVPKIVRGVVQKALDAKGGSAGLRNGFFIVWRATDYANVTEAAQNLGFIQADKAIKDGAMHGMYWGGVYHYFSNEHTANHLFAGVRKFEHVYLVEGTWGKVFTFDPSNTNGSISAIGVETRIDHVFKAWNNLVPNLFDVNVA